MPTGPKKWNREFDVETNEWRTICKSVMSICRENKVKEFQFKFLHRIGKRKKELNVDLELNKTVTAYIVGKKIPSITHSSTAVLHNL